MLQTIPAVPWDGWTAHTPMANQYVSSGHWFPQTLPIMTMCLRRPVGLLLSLAATRAEAGLPRSLRYARCTQGRGTRRDAVSSRRQKESGGFLSGRDDTERCTGSPNRRTQHSRLRSTTPSSSRRARRKGYRQHRLGDFSRCGDPSRLRDHWNMAHADRVAN